MKTIRYVFSLFVITILGCGQENSAPHQTLVTNSHAIVGGTETTFNDDHVTQVVLIHDRLTKRFCTGMLIEQNLVLTAAHCIVSPAEALNLAFGSRPLEGFYTLRYAKSFLIHPEYQSGRDIKTDINDLALIRLTEEAPEEYRPLLLPPPEMVLSAGEKLRAIGYGRTTGKTNPANPKDLAGSGTLRHTEVTVKSTSGNGKEFWIDQSNGKGICQGDSGGPAIKSLDGQNYLLGIATAVSWSVPANLSEEEKKRFTELHDICQQKAIYMNVSKYLNWIGEASQTLAQ